MIVCRPATVDTALRRQTVRPRLYKPRATLRLSLAPSVHVPTPGAGSHPCRHRSILAQSHVPVYFGHGVLPALFPVGTREFRMRTRISHLDYRRRVAAAGVSKYRCIPQVLAPENFLKTHPLSLYLDKLLAALTHFVEETPIDC